MCLATSLLTPSGESPQQDVLDDLALPSNLASVRGREIKSPTLAAEQSRPSSPPKLTSTTESPPDPPGSSPQPLAPKPLPYSQGSEPETTLLSTPNLNILLYPPLPKDNITSPIPQPSSLHTRSRLSYGDRVHLLPMREVPSPDGLARVHVPFFMTDLAQMKEKLGRYSENHTKFIEGFKSLTLQFDLSWADLHIIISTCCTPDEKKRIWDLAVEIGDEKALAGTWAGVPGRTAVPGQDPGWDYMNERNRLRRDHMIDCLLEAMQKGIRKRVNYNKLKEITQGNEENPALFLSRLVKTMKQYTNLHPDTDEGALILRLHFIGQSAPDFRRKLQKLDLGPQTPINQLMDAAFKVFHNRDLGETEGQSREKLLTSALTSLTYGQRPRGSCYTCGWDGHWSKDCPSKGRPPTTPCPACGRQGHWKRQCPTNQRPHRLQRHVPDLQSPEDSE
uniref:CCHC-type domain-containing protein n=1 Tax=Monodelphis domestica TaxID=13616 RepID=A0A5F8GXE4_MONDO